MSTKAWRIANPEKIREYREAHKEQTQAYNREYKEAHREQIQSYSREYGARNIKRSIEKHVTLPLAKVLSSDQVKEGEKTVIDYRDGKYEYSVQEND